MSKPSSTAAPTIPVGILVSEAPKPATRERPAPVKKPIASERRLPWLWIAVGGSALWLFIVAVVGVCSLASARPQQEPRIAAKRPAVAPVMFPAPIAEPEEPLADEFGPEPAPAPMEPVILIRQQPPQLGEVVRPLKLAADPPAQPPPPLKRPRKLVDTSVYASCEDIGSDVLFVRDPIEAFKRAKADKKIVFMVHLSGNLEDPGCT